MRCAVSDLSRAFLDKYGMLPETVDPSVCSDDICEDMKKGLAGAASFMPMIPTYLVNDGEVPKNEPVIVIDAGGTNFRCALLRFTDSGYELEGLNKCLMPGIKEPASWEEFISFIADRIEPFAGKTDKIGFCFSYEAEITPDIDGKVVVIDKEVVIEGSAGKLVGKSLSDELARRGYPGKKVVVLNDTAAVLLGGSASIDKSQYSTFIGHVSGTGTNCCCLVPMKYISKLGSDSEKSIIVNMEAGLYGGIAKGYFDELLDAESHNPGSKIIEKQTAGVYLGELVRLMIVKAAEDGIISGETFEKVDALGKINSAVIDAWAAGNGLDEVFATTDEAEFVKDISYSMIDRSARCMCSLLLGIAKCTGRGGEDDLPVCDFAEGSLVQKSLNYQPLLRKYLEEYGSTAGKKVELLIGSDSTLPGAGAAALLN